MRIVVGVDVHDGGGQVVAHAIAWARRLGGTLELAFASEWSTEGLPVPPFPTDELDRLWASWSERADEERGLLEAIAGQVPPELLAGARVHAGRPVDVLPELASAADLVIAATHSRSGLERIVLGSVAARLVRRASCPVLVVGLGDPVVPADRPISVWVPIDDEDACALPWVRDRFPRDRVEVVHVAAPELPSLLAGIEPPAERLERHRQVSLRLARLAADHGFPDAPLHLAPRESSNVGDTIARVAYEGGADVIVMPTHGRTGLDHLLLGSVAERVVDRASSAVLVVPKPRIAGTRPDVLDERV
ncbi:MAG: universal stress protein [Myxococcota bacterium]